MEPQGNNEMRKQYSEALKIINTQAERIKELEGVVKDTLSYFISHAPDDPLVWEFIQRLKDLLKGGK